MGSAGLFNACCATVVLSSLASGTPCPSDRTPVLARPYRKQSSFLENKGPSVRSFDTDPTEQVLVEHLTAQSGIQENPRTLWDPKSSLPCSQEPSSALILSQMNPERTPIFYLFYIHFNIVSSFTSINCVNGCFPLGFRT
jgi:hypothetical protein